MEATAPLVCSSMTQHDKKFDLWNCCDVDTFKFNHGDTEENGENREFKKRR